MLLIARLRPGANDAVADAVDAQGPLETALLAADAASDAPCRCPLPLPWSSGHG